MDSPYRSRLEDACRKLQFTVRYDPRILFPKRLPSGMFEKPEILIKKLLPPYGQYDDSHELRLISEYTSKTASHTAPLNKTQLEQKNDAVSTLNGSTFFSGAMKASSNNTKFQSPPTNTLSPTTVDNSAGKLASDLHMQATELSMLYMPDDTAQRKTDFQNLYIRVRSSSEKTTGSQFTNLPEMDILRAYLLHDGDANLSYSYLVAFSRIKELGFPDDQISTALLQYRNDEDAALDYLMK